MKRENLDIAEKLGLRDCKESLDKAHQLATTRKLTREKVANNDIDRPTQRGLWQARRDRRRGEILGEAIGIMRSVFIVIGRFASTYQTPPAHVLWPGGTEDIGAHPRDACSPVAGEQRSSRGRGGAGASLSGQRVDARGMTTPGDEIKAIAQGLQYTGAWWPQLLLDLMQFIAACVH
ncbi:unnamed protein product [Penicillium viridicatum]